ncbi:MAG TPA: NIPSNAP family protein [Candidatus Baltobacteraceae bacterium]|nr:NIPSNAP family protein [Candidatus Baltobacteraceae bacterium]
MSVVELRRYLMRPGRRDELIELFERAFIESQEACGMRVIGHYRVAGDPDTYLWFREFPDMRSRREALEAFYDRSHAWLSNRDAANATLLDSDNVLLLRPAREKSGFDVSGLTRAQGGEHMRFAALSIAMLPGAADTAYVRSFEDEVLPKLREAAERVAYFVTEAAANDFRLPVRSGEHAFVAIGRARNAKQIEAWRQAFGDGPAEHLRLEPASRSLY